MTDTKALQPQPKTYKRKADIVPMNGSDVTPTLNLSIDAMKQNFSQVGRKAIFPDTREGLEDFKAKTLSFFERLNEINDTADEGQGIIPDIELWCAALGITRMTLSNYSRRSDEWNNVIEYVRGIVAGIKKQMGMRYKVPPVVLMFDLCNNAGYVNSNEFHIQAEAPAPKKEMTLDEIAEQIGMNPADLDKEPDTAQGTDNGSRHGGYDFSDFMDYQND